MHQVIYKCRPQRHLPSPIWQECNGAQTPGRQNCRSHSSSTGAWTKPRELLGGFPREGSDSWQRASAHCWVHLTRAATHSVIPQEQPQKGTHRSLPANEDGLRLQKKSTYALYSILHGRCRLQGRNDSFVLPTNLSCGDTSHLEKRSRNDDEHLSHSTDAVLWSPYIKTRPLSMAGQKRAMRIKTHQNILYLLRCSCSYQEDLYFICSVFPNSYTGMYYFS